MRKVLERIYATVRGALAPVLFLLVLLPFQSMAQGGNPFWQNIPLPPTFRVVTVEPNSGKAILTWEAPAPSPNNPVPQGYLIYRETTNAAGDKVWTLVRTVPPTQFSWTDDDAHAKDGVVRYRIASKGSDNDKPSPMTDPHATIYLEVEYVPCLNKIRMKWTQYGGWNNEIENYIVRAGDRQSWTSLTEFATLKGAQWEYEFDSGQDKTWYLFIEARRTGTGEVTRSNMCEVITRKQYIPSTILLDSIISSPHQNRLTLKMNLNSNPAYFRLVRQNVFDEAEGKLEAIEILRFTDPTTRELIDAVDPDQIQGRKRFYSIIAMDECDAEVDRSQKSNSIIVRVSSRGSSNIVTWDQLEVEEGNRAEYRVHRIITKPTGVEDLEMATVHGGSELRYIDDLSELEGQGVKNDFCYKVFAYELTADNSTKRVSISAPHCTQADSKIEIPTAISPMETAATGNKLARNVFAPLTTYDSNYKMYIYNRVGELIYTGEGKGWNGKLRDGTYAPEGAYIYRIEFYFAERGSQVRTGSFMVVYPTR